MQVTYLGRGVPYAQGMRAMRDAMARVDDDGPVLLLLEHAPVITVTRRGGTSFVVTPAEELATLGIDVVQTDRGGDVTFHGPGQLVGYPVLRLGHTSLGAGVADYVRALEGVLMTLAQSLGASQVHRVDGMTGVWCRAERAVLPGGQTALDVDAKLCALGVGVSGGVTRHGFALNVTTDLTRFLRHIVPCGLVGRAVTTLQGAVSRPVPFDEAVRAATEIVGQGLAPMHRRRADEGSDAPFSSPSAALPDP